MKINKNIFKLSEYLYNAIKKIGNVLFCTAKEFFKDEAMIVANGLAFKTIFSLIPLAAVFVYVSSIFPAFSNYKGKIAEIIVEYLLPDVSADLLKIIDSFISNVGTVGLVGIIGLIYISLSLFLTIDNQVNRIWHVRRCHSYLQRILIYWAFLSFLPFLLGGYFYYSKILGSFLLPIFPKIDNFHSRILSFILLELFFFFVYYAIPNIKVHFSKALIVAALSALFWTILRWIFSYYTKIAIGNWVIYGSVAAVVFAFVWIYFNWLVLLFGVELIKVWQEKLYLRQPIIHKFFLYDLGIIIYILKTLDDDFKKSGYGVTLDEFSHKLNISRDELTMLFQLLKENFIVTNDSDNSQCFHLSRNTSSIMLEEVEMILWKKMQLFCKTTEKEAAEICEKIGCHYVKRKGKNLSIEDIFCEKTNF